MRKRKPMHRPRRFESMRILAQYSARRLLGEPLNVAAALCDDGRVEFCVFDVLGNGVWTATDLTLRRKFQTGRELRSMAAAVFELTRSLWLVIDAEVRALH